MSNASLLGSLEPTRLSNQAAPLFAALFAASGQNLSRIAIAMIMAIATNSQVANIPRSKFDAGPWPENRGKDNDRNTAQWPARKATNKAQNLQALL